MKTKLQMTAVFEKADEGGYIGFIEELPGVNTQGETLEETKANLLEALHLVMETRRVLFSEDAHHKELIREPLEFA